MQKEVPSVLLLMEFGIKDAGISTTSVKYFDTHSQFIVTFGISRPVGLFVFRLLAMIANLLLKRFLLPLLTQPGDVWYQTFTL